MLTACEHGTAIFQIANGAIPEQAGTKEAISGVLAASQEFMREQEVSVDPPRMIVGTEMLADKYNIFLC